MIRADCRTSSSRERALKVTSVFAAVLINTLVGPVASAQSATADGPVRADPVFGALVGRWMRPDGGYVITIKAVDAGGTLDAGYANPNQLPFHLSAALRDVLRADVFWHIERHGAEHDGRADSAQVIQLSFHQVTVSPLTASQHMLNSREPSSSSSIISLTGS